MTCPVTLKVLVEMNDEFNSVLEYHIDCGKKETSDSVKDKLVKDLNGKFITFDRKKVIRTDDISEVSFEVYDFPKGINDMDAICDKCGGNAWKNEREEILCFNSIDGECDM